MTNNKRHSRQHQTQSPAGQTIIVDLPAQAPLLHDISLQPQSTESITLSLPSNSQSVGPAKHTQTVAKRLERIETEQDITITTGMSFTTDMRSVAEEGIVGGLPESDTTLGSQEDEQEHPETTSARSRAFGVTEIFEHILVSLPIRDLLLAQRISKHFQQVIEDSITLQRALFFKPAPATRDGKAVTPVINPLLAKPTRLSPRDKVPMLLTTHDNFHGPKGTPLILFVEALGLQYSPMPFEHQCYAQHFEVRVRLDNVLCVEWLGGAIGTTVCYSKGSWQRMLATQPPCQVNWQVLGSFADKTRGQIAGLQSVGEWFIDRAYSEAEPATVEHYKKWLEEGVDLARPSISEGDVACNERGLSLGCEY